MARKKNFIKNSYFNVIIIPEHESKTKSFKFSVLWLRIVGSIFIVLFLSVCYFVYDNYNFISKSSMFDKMVEQNKNLIRENERVKLVYFKLEKLENFRKQTVNALSNSEKYKDFKFKDSALDSAIRALASDEKVNKITDLTFSSIPSIAPVLNPVLSRKYESGTTEKSGHLGIDLVAKSGTPIIATASGTVVFSNWTADFGYMIIVQHAYNYVTIYKHNERNIVAEGQYVGKGEILGYLGNTGTISTGAHSHFELWHNNNAINPGLLIKSLL